MATQAAHPLPAETLRRARLRRRTSLERASRETRISIDYLLALESGVPLSEFPSPPVYARFFLREYARYLGLDEERMVRAFDPRLERVSPSPVSVLPKKYEALGPEATRVAQAVKRGREVPLPRAFLPKRRRPSPIPVGPTTLDRRPGRRSTRSMGVAMLSVAILATALGVALRPGGGDGDGGASAAARAANPPKELPRGGRTIFPAYRVIAFYGAPNTTQLGILGVGPEEAARKLLAQAKAYERRGRRVLPAFELISTVAGSHAGPDGLYRFRQSFLDIQRYLEAAREARALLLLDVQPGRGDFLNEVRIYEPFLRQPDVGLGLDPEWAVGPDGVPGQVLGSVNAATVNRIIEWLSGMVRRYRLPQKLLVVHQFTEDMIRNRHRIRPTPEVTVVFDIDGWGGRAVKIAKYQSFAELEGYHYGFKLFYDKDEDLLSPLDVTNLYPPPDFVVYQ